MSALFFLLLAGIVSGLGCTVLHFHTRVPSSPEAGVDSFRRSMDALSGAGRMPDGEE